MWSICHHLFYLVLLLNSVAIVSSASREIKSGPYRSMITRISPCRKPSYPLLRNPPMKVDIDIYNTSSKPFLMHGNFTITRNVTNAKTKIKSYLWVNGKWKVNFFVDNLGCNEKMVPILCALLNIKFDEEHCKFLKGVYHFENIDTNELVHFITRTLDYGRTLWTCEIYLGGKTFQTSTCKEYETWSVPL